MRKCFKTFFVVLIAAVQIRNHRNPIARSDSGIPHIENGTI